MITYLAIKNLFKKYTFCHKDVSRCLIEYGAQRKHGHRVVKHQSGWARVVEHQSEWARVVEHQLGWGRVLEHQLEWGRVVEHQSPYPTLTDAPQPYPTLIDAPKLYPTLTDAPQPYTTLTDAPQPYPTLTDAPQPYPTLTDAPQPYPTLTDAPQPYPTLTDAPQPYPTLTDAPQPYPTLTDAPQPYPTLWSSIHRKHACILFTSLCATKISSIKCCSVATVNMPLQSSHPPNHQGFFQCQVKMKCYHNGGQMKCYHNGGQMKCYHNGGQDRLSHVFHLLDDNLSLTYAMNHWMVQSVHTNALHGSSKLQWLVCKTLYRKMPQSLLHISVKLRKVKVEIELQKYSEEQQLFAEPPSQYQLTESWVEKQTFSNTLLGNLLITRLEAGSGLTPGLDRTRPADALVRDWAQGKPAALDITVTSPLTPAILAEASRWVGAAAEAAENRKHTAND
eukprot:Em0013g991a